MATCTLCGLSIPGDPVTDPDVDGTFCCRGCLTVHQSVETGEANEALTEAIESDEDESPLPDPAMDGETAYLSVDGMHCATCETLLESRAAQVEGVTGASASYAADVMKVSFDDAASIDEVVDAVGGTGYSAQSIDDDQTGDDTTVTELRLIIGGFIGMMLMLWYFVAIYPTYLGAESMIPITQAGREWLRYFLFPMATAVLVIVGFPLFRGAYVSIAAMRPNMDVLVTIAALGAYGYSVVALLGGQSDLYFDVSVVIVIAVSVGNYYEDRIKRRTSGTLRDLSDESATEARKVGEDGPTSVPIDSLAAGDRVVVRGGETIPLDGRVVDGSGEISQTFLTGSEVPEHVEAGDTVFGGSTVEDGALTVTVGENTHDTKGHLTDVVWDVQATHTRLQELADRLAMIFVPAVLVLATIALVVGLLVGPVQSAILTALAVLVVSCPCAFGIATPLAVSAGMQAAFQEGIVITDGSVFERAGPHDVAILDKTGTLTTGDLAIERVVGDEAGLDRAAALEQSVDHPIATAIVSEGRPGKQSVADVDSRPQGIAGTVDGHRTLVGHPETFASAEWTVPSALAGTRETAREEGARPIFVGWDGRVRTVLVLSDPLRDDWEATVSDIADGVDSVVVLTGDDSPAHGAIEAHPAVDTVVPDARPQAKAEMVAQYQAGGDSIVMVGDGSNDAPALATADLGVALGKQALATAAADLVITDATLETVPVLFEILPATRRRIRQNLTWALGYNAIAIPVALLGLLNPAIAAAAMATSSLIVVGNSSRSLHDSDRSLPSITVDAGLGDGRAPARDPPTTD